MKRDRRRCIHNYCPSNRDELKKLIKERIKNEGPNCDLNDIDVSEITDMASLFFATGFNGDISSWDVSSVENMCCMFHGSPFNGDISKWDVSNVEEWNAIFRGCPLEDNPPPWYKP